MPTLGPIETMTYSAARTERIRLGCVVFVTPLHSPVHLAIPNKIGACGTWASAVLGRQITITGRTIMTTDPDKTAIRAVITAIHKGLHDRDAAAVTAHYVSDAMVFDLAPPLSHTVDRAAVAAWLGTWKGPVDRQARELDISVSGDLALWHGYFRTTATTTAGDHAVWWERATLAFRRETGPWRVVHEHTSVPFYMDGSFRAAVDLEP